MRLAHCLRIALTLALAPALLGSALALGDDTPEALLKDKGLTRTRTVFSDKEKEAPVLEALQGLKPLAETMDETFGELADAMAIEERFRVANENEASITAEIDRARIQLAALPNNRQTQAARTQLQDNQRSLELQRTEAVKEKRSTAPLRVAPQRLDFLKTKYQAANNAYYEAAKPINSSLKEISGAYSKLAADTSVKAALGAYGRTAKVRVTVGRSKDLQDAITWKSRVEKAHRPYKPQPASQTSGKGRGRPPRRR
jgi:hypothetical protein